MSMKPFVAEALSSCLKGRRILLGITGSVAAFKACDLIRLLRQCGAEVKVVPTANALRFVTVATLENLSGHEVITDLWQDRGTHHIATARWAQAIVVAPCTANTLAKIALGLADDLLSTEILAHQGPLFVAPAMNPAMFSHDATQTHMNTLRRRGAVILGPLWGPTSCGEEGWGRFLEPQDLVESLALQWARREADPLQRRAQQPLLGKLRSHPECP